MTERDGQTLDLVVRGGRVIDPGRGIDEQLDIGVQFGRIVMLEPDLAGWVRSPVSEYPPDLGTVVIDASGKIVVPGLIDMHAHVYTGVCPLTVPADETSSRSGVTTIVSAGDAGAHTIEGFRHLVVNPSRTRVFAFVHISTIGLAGWPEGEAVDLAYLDVDKAVRAAIENADIVVGIKVREQGIIVGDNELEPVRRAVEAGERVGLPVMVHIGGAPAPLSEILDILRPGDIVTHCYTPIGNGIVEDNRLIDAAEPARQKGIIFDSGHGFGSFDYATAEIAFEAGFWPDTISTDLHSLSASGPVGDLPTTMSKFLNLGMPLHDVIRATTTRPADVIGRRETIGSLRIGSVADVTVLDLVSGDFEFRDSSGAVRIAPQRLAVSATIRAGIPWGAPLPHPGRTPFAPPPDSVPPPPSRETLGQLGA
jgi:dihydroorotase